MSPPNKTKKMVIKIPRHPFIRAESDLNYENGVQIRKCRVNLERIKGFQVFPLKPNKQKRCCVRVARLPNVERSEMSVTPASSIVCSDFDNDTADE
ncbi:uncharacterized protein LOC117787842 [Drosophila innubila]|uniref:uncharacterized protein LOC117787842 n=1 Tax=Drosophila innubila TaxID=198719 RepID=UPI00148DB6D7|nr:uncharacterized protein LOC117787842 [Drosophila innubila]